MSLLKSVLIVMILLSTLKIISSPLQRYINRIASDLSPAQRMTIYQIAFGLECRETHAGFEYAGCPRDSFQ